jgi:hypothetical protein
MAYIYNMADTWADAGVTFTAIKMNVTDTASNAASLLMDLQVGGVSIASVRKNGLALFGPTAAFVNGIGIGTPSVNVGAGANVASNFAGGQVNIWDSNLNVASLNAGGLALRSTGTVAWGSGTSVATADLFLARDAANTLAQRNGVNAQAFRVYNTFTDASNYERGFARWSSNELQIGTENAGTGAARDLRLVPAMAGNGNIAGQRLQLGSATTLYEQFGYLTFLSSGNGVNILQNLLVGGNIDQTAGKYFQMGEGTAPAAPATNNVRIYAEDNGSGKTRLMARFATGAAVQIAIEP